MSKALVITKINFKNLKLAYIITAITVAAQLLSDSIQYIIIKPSGQENNSIVSIGHYLFLLVILSAIFIPALNFSKIMHLNGKKLDFFKGSFINYVVFSAFASALSTICYLTLDRLYLKSVGVFNLIDIFRWADNGVFIAFLQQFAFLLLLALFIHTLTAMQTFWFGWVTDAILISIISVFTPIAPLRNALIWFFNMSIFEKPLIQIPVCLVLGLLIYAVNIPVLSRKRI